MTAAKAPSEAEILAALKKIPDPDRRQDIVALGMVQGLIHDIPTCAELVSRIVREAEAIVGERLDRMRVVTAS